MLVLGVRKDKGSPIEWIEKVLGDIGKRRFGRNEKAGEIYTRVG